MKTMAGEPFANPERVAFILLTDRLTTDVERSVIKQCGAALDAMAQAINAPFLDMATFIGADKGLQLGADLSQAIATVRRRSFVLGGGVLEGVVSQAAIQGLLDGYNDFVPADLTVCADGQWRDVTLNRIRDAAGVVTTRRQLILDLLAQEPKPDSRSILERMWAGL